MVAFHLGDSLTTSPGPYSVAGMFAAAARARATSAPRLTATYMPTGASERERQLLPNNVQPCPQNRRQSGLGEIADCSTAPCFALAPSHARLPSRKSKTTLELRRRADAQVLDEIASSSR